MVIELGWEQALGWRLHQQRITSPVADPTRLVAALGGVQAQVMSSAKQVIGIRSRATGDTVDRLLWRQRRLVKTWAMRGTLHLLPADEFWLWVAALGAREWRITPGWEKYHGISRSDLDAVTDAIPEVLSDEPMTRDELAETIADRVKRPHLDAQLRSGWAAVFKPAANRGLLCQGPPVDGGVTFVSPARWLGHTGTEPDRDAALAAVLARFLETNGPATHEDFARWLGVMPKQGRQIAARHVGELAEVSVDGARAWMTPAGARAAARAEPADGVYLLPGFDPYVLAPISHRNQTIPAGRVDDVSRSAGWISPVLVVDGRVAGTWTGEQAGFVTRVTITPFATLPARVIKAARDHVNGSYTRVLGPKFRVTVGNPGH